MEELVKLLAKQLGKKPDEFSALIKKADDGQYSLADNAEEVLAQSFTAYEEDLRPALRKEMEREARNNALAAVRSEVEKDFRRTFGLPQEITFKELPDAIQKKIEEAAKSDLEEDKVKAHPLYKDLTKQLAQKDEEFEKKIKEVESGFTEKEKQRTVQGTIMGIATALPIAIEDAAVKDRQLKAFIREFDGYGVDPDEKSGKMFVTQKSGELLQVDGKPITLEDFVTREAKTFFPLKKDTPQGGAGAGAGAGAGQGQGSGDGGNTYLFKDESDYLRQRTAAKTVKERVEMTKAWEAQNKKE